MGSLVSSVANVFTGAKDTQQAGQLASIQQQQAAKEAAAAAAFRPVGMTTRFGTSEFTRTIDPSTGMPYISAAGYTAAPELSSLQNQLFRQFGSGANLGEATASQYLPLAGAANQLFSLGAQQLAESPEAARQRYIQGQQAALAPQQEQTIANIRNQLFQSGRSGLATGGTVAGNMQATNPELAAYYNALAQQQAQINAGADAAVQAQQQAAAQMYGQGAGLLGTMATGQAASYAPLQNLLGLSSQVDTLAQQPYQLGLQLGTAAMPGQTAGANLYGQGMAQAAQTQYGATQAANAANAGFWGGLISGAAQGAGSYYGAQAAGAAAAGGSDIRLKENIKHVGVLPSGLNLYEYEYKPEYKDRANTGHGKFIGVMAQEAELVIPEAVSFDADGFRQVDYSLIH
jgi:hypothetical protein